ncbi:hypothetical protein [Obesumbacterium proteus]|uniref:hypothetical protein n=1 Tax=Obesumbacterium proteus TaxID=82983 RepID=UPI00242EA0FA|nr:hypothetical protein [Obesumbacterium proteus]
MQNLMPPINTPDNLFHDGNPLTGEQGTIVTAEHLNNEQSAIRNIQSEILSVLTDSGITPEPDNQHQLLDALKLIIGLTGNAKFLMISNNLKEISDAGPNAVASALEHLGLIVALSKKANLDSPSFKGTPSVPSANQDEIDYRIANTAFVAQAIANLNGGAPSGLNTLKKLALAVNSDANFSTTVSNALGGKAAQSDFASSKTATAIVGNQPGGLRFMCGEASVPTDVNGNVFITLPDTFLNKLVYAEAHQSKNNYTADTEPFLFSSYPAAAGSTSIVGFAVRNSRTGMPFINSAINLTYFVRGY